MGKKFTYEEFVLKASKKFKHKYQYPWDSDKIDNDFLIAVVCPIHGEVKMYPLEHLRIGCVKCERDAYKGKNKVDIDRYLDFHDGMEKKNGKNC